jgi:hypothetical protein
MFLGFSSVRETTYRTSLRSRDERTDSMHLASTCLSKFPIPRRLRLVELSCVYKAQIVSVRELVAEAFHDII